MAPWFSLYLKAFNSRCAQRTDGAAERRETCSVTRLVNAPARLGVVLKLRPDRVAVGGSRLLNKSTAHSFGHREYMYIIKSAGGSYDVRKLSAMGVNSSEAEFLYPPDTKFRIVDIYNDPDGIVKHPVYEIEEVPDVDLEKRRALDKAAGPWDPEAEGDQWPEGYDTWSHERRQAWWIARFKDDLDYVPTDKELAEAKHLGEKMDSASGHNQVNPNADLG